MSRPAEAAITPGAAARELAMLGSIATRIEPELLRALRLEGHTGLDVTAEAELWFSDFVATRSATGLVLSDRYLAELRAALAADPVKLERAWDITRRVHAEVSPALRVEEELVYLTLKGLDDKPTREHAQTLLRQIVATLVDDSRRGAVAWADRALTRFPADLMALDEAQMLAVGTAYRSGRGGHFDAAGENATSGNLRWLEPTDRQRQIGVQLYDSGIEFAGGDYVATQFIDVPDTDPVRLTIDWQEDNETKQELVVLPRNERRFVPLDADTVTVSVLGGDQYTISESDSFEPEQERVRITYDVERNGSVTSVELPFVIGVLADLRGDQESPTRILARRFTLVSPGDLDGLAKLIRPRIAPRISAEPFVEAEIIIELEFLSLKDFEPSRVLDSLMRAAPDFHRVTDARKTLQQLHERAESHITPEDILARFEKTMQDPNDVALYVRERIEELLNPETLESGGLQQAVHGVIASLDRDLAELVNRVLHHEDFLRLESAWRGLAFLVDRIDPSANIKVLALDLSRDELRDLAQSNPEPDRVGDPLYLRLAEETFGTLAGEPFGLVVADYYLTNTMEGIDELRYLARLGSSAGVPIVSGSSPGSFGFYSWKEVEDAGFLENPEGPDQEQWREFRGTLEARFLQLCIPRLLARNRHDRREAPVDSILFDEMLDEPVADNLPWINSAHAMAVNAARAFAREGWFARMRGEDFSRIEDVPRFSIDLLDESAWKTKEAHYAAKAGPTDGAISLRLDHQFALAGFSSFCASPEADSGAFYSTVTSYRSPEARDDVDTAARGNNDLRYMLVAARFGNFLRCIVRDGIGAFASIRELEDHLSNWIVQFVSPDRLAPTDGPPNERLIGPATIMVRENDSSDSLPGSFVIDFYVRPYHQFSEDGAPPGLSNMPNTPDSEIVLTLPIPFEPMGFAEEFAEEAPVP